MASEFNFPIINLGEQMQIGGALFGVRLVKDGESSEDTPITQVPAIVFGEFTPGAIQPTDSISCALLVPDVQAIDQLMQVMLTFRRKLFPGA